MEIEHVKREREKEREREKKKRERERALWLRFQILRAIL